MRLLLRFSLFGLAMLAASGPALAQGGLWRDASKTVVAAELANAPAAFRAVSFDQTMLSGRLLTAKAGGAPLSLPLPEGGSVEVVAQERSVLDPAFQARHPEIRSYTLSGPSVSGRMSVTPLGVNALYFTSEGAISILPSRIRTGRHAVYYTRDVTPPPGIDLNEFVTESTSVLLATQLSTPPQIGGSLRTYRIAVAVTGELTQQVGGVSMRSPSWQQRLPT